MTALPCCPPCSRWPCDALTSSRGSRRVPSATAPFVGSLETLSSLTPLAPWKGQLQGHHPSPPTAVRPSLQDPAPQSMDLLIPSPFSSLIEMLNNYNFLAPLFLNRICEAKRWLWLSPNLDQLQLSPPASCHGRGAHTGAPRDAHGSFLFSASICSLAYLIPSLLNEEGQMRLLPEYS